jgi:DNA-directed RNA polymerase specialized sigma24 family protein
MTEQPGIKLAEKPNPYATREDFINVFNDDRDELYQLSFLLTRNHVQAEKCFVTGLEDCVKENRVFREWANSWAKRIIVENAIRELKPRPNLPRRSSVHTVFGHSAESHGLDRHFDVDAVLRLEDFERFVFVMSTLEQYSQHECALLLGCSILEIWEGLHSLKELARPSQAIFSAT